MSSALILSTKMNPWRSNGFESIDVRLDTNWLTRTALRSPYLVSEFEADPPHISLVCVPAAHQSDHLLLRC